MKTYWVGLSILFLFFNFGAKAATEKSSPIYSIPLKTIDGTDTSLAPYKGKVIMIVNTASKCGYTPQYKGLQAIYDKYKDRGFVILGFPSNDFLWQEPGENKEIKMFCELKYKVSFPLFEKAKVRGDDKQPLYAYLLADEKEKPEIRWNFEKFIINQKGEKIARFKPAIEPDSKDVTDVLEKALSPSATTAPATAHP